MELVADLEVDSAKALQLLVEIEDTLGVEISDEEAEELNTVRDVMSLVESRAGDATRSG
jgi:acyl carrier protein